MTTLFVTSCNEDEFLNEVPIDFLSPENAYVTANDFDAALVNLYSRFRENFTTSATATEFPSLSWTGTDMIYTHKDLGVKPDWGGSVLLPTNTPVVYDGLWRPAYLIIYDANVIIGRSQSEISELTEDQARLIQAEAMFFRGYMYKMLANLYGDVPIVLEEVLSPRRDFERASRSTVYEQSAADLKFAAENTLDIDQAQDSRINNLVAYHVLSEVYISLGKYDEAIAAASKVIDHPSTALMTERFGTMVDQMEFGGDVYWDLFRAGNQNRSTGNSEALWVIQYEFNVPGGADGALMTRLAVPRLWQAKVTNADGSAPPMIPYPNASYYGRGSGFINPSKYLYDGIWQKSGYDSDIRNSEYNIVRDFKVNNPDSDYDGQWIFKDNLPIALSTSNDTSRNFFPVFAKLSTVGQIPTELYLADQTVPGSLTSAAQATYRDRYMVRLAETYLLRAEAYLGKNNLELAAADINTVRRRAQAPEIQASDVTLDYLLDERLRELHFESFRLLTLTRLGKLVERTKKYNTWVGDFYNEFNNLWPIPFNEIEKNTEVDLGQNPGY
ncbi:hypothetical protein GCM10025777_04470 [Membranihabitans marinus]